MTNQEIADHFIAAKKILWDGISTSSHPKYVFICSAIVFANSRTDKAMFVKGIIIQRMSPYNILEQFLAANGITEYSKPTLMQEYRHFWIDELIREYSSNA